MIRDRSPGRLADRVAHRLFADDALEQEVAQTAPLPTVHGQPRSGMTRFERDPYRALNRQLRNENPTTLAILRYPYSTETVRAQIGSPAIQRGSNDVGPCETKACSKCKVVSNRLSANAHTLGLSPTAFADLESL